MPVRRVIVMPAVSGKGAELAKALEEQCVKVRQEPGCLQFEAFQSSRDPDSVCLLQLWVDQAAFDVHRALPIASEVVKLRAEDLGTAEEYEYNRTR